MTVITKTPQSKDLPTVRGRVFVPLFPSKGVAEQFNIAQTPFDRGGQFAQKTIPDTRVPGQVFFPGQFKKQKLLSQAQRQANAKHYPLKNGMPFVPSITPMRTGVSNLFDHKKAQLGFCFENNKQPEDSLLKNHPGRDSYMKVQAQCLAVAASNEEAKEEAWYHMINDNNIRELYFLEDRPHDQQGHRNRVNRNGLVSRNAFQEMEKTVELANGLRTAHKLLHKQDMFNERRML